MVFKSKKVKNGMMEIVEFLQMTQDLDSMELEHMENINTVGSTATRKVAGMTGRTKGILFF